MRVNIRNRMISRTMYVIGFVMGVFLLTSFIMTPDWGFFGHRKINRMAVFTLPPEMLQFYKKNIEFITEHAIDPDKRRYASKHEAVRHYIDIDSWGDNPFYDVPRIFEDALIKYAKYELVNGSDNNSVQVTYTRDSITFEANQKTVSCVTDTFRTFFRDSIMPDYYEGSWEISSSDLDILLPGFSSGSDISITDKFSEEGILPYHMNMMYLLVSKGF